MLHNVIWFGNILTHVLLLETGDTHELCRRSSFLRGCREEPRHSRFSRSFWRNLHRAELAVWRRVICFCRFCCYLTKWYFFNQYAITAKGELTNLRKFCSRAFGAVTRTPSWFLQGFLLVQPIIFVTRTTFWLLKGFCCSIPDYR